MAAAALVVCPGRGSYNRSELGYLARSGPPSAFLDMADELRRRLGQPTLRELDGADRFDSKQHGRGDHASPLIFACGYADFLNIDRSEVNVVAVTGNSMGWYTALACTGALSPEHGLALVQTMGAYMQEALIGGQAIYRFVDETWRPIPGRREQLIDLIDQVHGREGRELYASIHLGGMLLVAGNDAGLAAFEAQAPQEPDGPPIRLLNHAGFHSPMQDSVSAKGKASVSRAWFGAPSVPLIDGRGAIWRPFASDPRALWDYTLGAQVTTPYDFNTAIRVSVREFAPDLIIVLGPGDTLGGATAQALIAAQWEGVESKSAFQAMQVAAPRVISMARDEQRARVVGSSLQNVRD